MKADGAFDDDDGDALAEALEAEDQLQENVVNAVGWALKAKRDAFADGTFKSTVLPHYAPVLTKANAREKDVHAALCTLIDVVEHGGASGLVSQAAPTVLGCHCAWSAPEKRQPGLEQRRPTASPSSLGNAQML